MSGAMYGGAQKEYRGYLVESVEGAREKTATTMQKLPGVGKGYLIGSRSRKLGTQYLVHLPDGGTKTVSTIAAAKKYIDAQVGDSGEDANATTKAKTQTWVVFEVRRDGSFGSSQEFKIAIGRDRLDEHKLVERAAAKAMNFLGLMGVVASIVEKNHAFHVVTSREFVFVMTRA